MADDRILRHPSGPVRAPATYTIFLTGFQGAVTTAAAESAPVRFDLALTVAHPGPGFPDDIAAVMSYEDIVQALRALCAEAPAADAGRLAARAAELSLANPKVHAVRVRVEGPPRSGGPEGERTTGAEVVRQRT